MIIRTFLDKCTTIVKDDYDNYGLNPVIKLNYGYTNSRAVIHFNIDKIKEYFGNGDYESSKEAKHILHMTNCGSINPKDFHKLLPSKDEKAEKKRASSFDLILFKINEEWDRGVGFDDSEDFWFRGDRAVSKDGCNWYNRKNGIGWANEGIYSRSQLYEELSKFENGLDSIIIAVQHFDSGNEDLEVDLTDYINNIINGVELNRGIGISFSPSDEDLSTGITRYVGFFTDKTNTFYVPYIESRSLTTLTDERNSVIIGKDSKLFLFANISGELSDLDALPTCSIKGQEYYVKQAAKGVYYAEVNLPKKEFEQDTIYCDKWSNLKFQGVEIDDVKMEFYTAKSNSIFNIGNNASKPLNYSVVINGISNREKLNRGEVKGLLVDFKKPYTHSTMPPIGKSYYRLYILSGEKEYEVIKWDNIDISGNSGYFTIRTEELLPQKYFIDIKTEFNGQIKIFKKQLEFEIVNEL